MRLQELALIIATFCTASFSFHAASAIAFDAQTRDPRIASTSEVDNSESNSLPFLGEATLGADAFESTTVASLVDEETPEDASRFRGTVDESDSFRNASIGGASILSDVPSSGESDFPEAQFDSISDAALTTLESNSQKGAVNLLPEDSSILFDSDSGWLGRESIGASLKAVLVMSVLAIAPAFLLMTTSFVRISVVLFLLRQALGAGQIPSNQVVATLAVFLTALVMSPVGVEIYQKAIVPYSENQISRNEAFQIGQEPVRTFLWKQIERTGNSEMIGLFIKYLPDVDEPKYYEDVPWRALAPAFLLSELKTAFLIGFQIFLPFLIIDFVVSCVLVSTGMMMLPPAIISLPLKLALFVMVDGWTLIVKSLLESFA